VWKGWGFWLQTLDATGVAWHGHSFWVSWFCWESSNVVCWKITHLQMIFPAINLHLVRGYSIAMVDDQSVKGTGLTLASWLLVSENNKLVGEKPIRVGASLEELGGHHVRMKNRSNVANSSKPNYSPNQKPTINGDLKKCICPNLPLSGFTKPKFGISLTNYL